METHPYAGLLEIFRVEAQITTHEFMHLSDAAGAFQSKVEGIREGAAILSFDRTAFTCNRSLAELLKLDCEPLTGRSILAFLLAQDQPRLEAMLRSEPAEFRWLPVQFSRGNAFPLPVELTVRALTVGGRSIFSLLAIDLRRRHRAEEKLALQSHLLANVNDGVIATAVTSVPTLRLVRALPSM